MRRLLALVLLAALALPALAQAPARPYNQAELDALLAPVALYPDALLSNVLVASTYPEDLREAAYWSRSNPHLGGEPAVQAVQPMPWHPSVKALVATPELLARMDESPRWTADLAAAFLNQEPHVMDTVQGLRRRAQASGYLESTPEYQVQHHGQAIAVYPARPHAIYVPYYDPYVVYGPWWWHSYRPVYWRPWHPRPAVYVSTSFFHSSVDWHRRHVHRWHNHVQHRHVQPRAFAPRAVDVARHVTAHSHAQPAGPTQARQRHEVRSADRQFALRAADVARQAALHNHANPHARPIAQSVPRPHTQSPQVTQHSRGHVPPAARRPQHTPHHNRQPQQQRQGAGQGHRRG